MAKQRKLQAETGAGQSADIHPPDQPPRPEKAARPTKAVANDTTVKEADARRLEIDALERDISELSRLTDPTDTTRKRSAEFGAKSRN